MAILPWPEYWPTHFNGSDTACDVMEGPCCCGAWHMNNEFKLVDGKLHRFGKWCPSQCHRRDTDCGGPGRPVHIDRWHKDQTDDALLWSLSQHCGNGFTGGYSCGCMFIVRELRKRGYVLISKWSFENDD